MKNNIEKAYFAGGCFWWIEYHFQKLTGIVETKVGYMWWNSDNPSYEEVSYHNTGQVEVVEIIFDTEKISFKTIAKIFFEIHDPTQVDGQGPDIGNQYRSIIFYTTPKQKDITEKLIVILKEKWYKVVTELKEATRFWKAEEYHQEYYDKKNTVPYCHIYTKRF